MLILNNLNITSAKFIKGIVGTDEKLEDSIPQVAFIGRSNVGKSTTINALTSQNKLAITSSYPGRTQQINMFLVNESIYFLDLPGYGYARVSGQGLEKIQELIYWYFFTSGYKNKYVVLIVDANVGPTKYDIEMFEHLEKAKKNILIIANKVDKIKKSEYHKKMKTLQSVFKGCKVIPFSALKKIGVQDVIDELLA